MNGFFLCSLFTSVDVERLLDGTAGLRLSVYVEIGEFDRSVDGTDSPKCVDGRAGGKISIIC